MGGPSLGSKRLPLKQTQTEKGVNNANSRRSRAFRAGLVRAVALGLLQEDYVQAGNLQLQMTGGRLPRRYSRLCSEGIVLSHDNPLLSCTMLCTRSK